jgi:hypothetical protein
MDWLKNAFIKWLGITPATSQLNLTIREGITKEANVLKNRLWYRGDPVELEQFFKQLAEMSSNVSSSIAHTRFWAASPANNQLVRKLHSGLPRLIADKLAQIVLGDMNESEMEQVIKTRWDEFRKHIDFEELLKQAITDTLVEGDGAFKICVDPEVSDKPLLEFYSGNNVEFKYQRGQLIEIVFFMDYWKESKHYKLAEYYGKGYVNYKLFNDLGNEVPLETLEETALLQDVTFEGNYIMGVPLKIYSSAKWKGRGESIF